MRTTLRTAAIAMLLATALTACGGDDEPSASPPTSEQSWSETDLIGEWDVAIEGQGDTDATFTGSEVALAPSCGRTVGWWVVDDQGRFKASMGRWPSGCDYASGDEIAPWLSNAARVARTGSGITLLSADGAVLATLTDRVGSTAPSTTAPAAPASAPAGARPATHDDLLGSWDSPNAPATGATGLTVADDGTYSGSDGCNAVTGIWAISDGGSLDVTSGPKTLVGCGGTPAADQFGQAAWVLVDGEQLVLVGADGAELGRLAPSPSAAGASTPPAG